MPDPNRPNFVDSSTERASELTICHPFLLLKPFMIRSSLIRTPLLSLRHPRIDLTYTQEYTTTRRKMSSIAERLAALSITPTPSSSSAVRLVTHAFKPKGGPEGTKLVLVSVEEGKELGKASGLAKKVGLGLKDLRSADEDSVREILGVAKRFGEFSWHPWRWDV